MTTRVAIADNDVVSRISPTTDNELTSDRPTNPIKPPTHAATTAMSRRWSGSSGGGGGSGGGQENKELLLLRQEVEVRCVGRGLRAWGRTPICVTRIPTPNLHPTKNTQRLRALVPPARRQPRLLVLDLNGFLVHRVFMGGDGAYAPPTAFIIYRGRCAAICLGLVSRANPPRPCVDRGQGLPPARRLQLDAERLRRLRAAARPRVPEVGEDRTTTHVNIERVRAPASLCLPPVRPFRFCLDNFHVGVWTTASANNATPLIEGLLDPVRRSRQGFRTYWQCPYTLSDFVSHLMYTQTDMAKIAFIWDGKRCTYNGQTDPLKPGKPIAFKVRTFPWGG